jgi:hypothetical protein
VEVISDCGNKSKSVTVNKKGEAQVPVKPGDPQAELRKTEEDALASSPVPSTSLPESCRNSCQRSIPDYVETQGGKCYLVYKLEEYSMIGCALCLNRRRALPDAPFKLHDNRCVTTVADLGDGQRKMLIGSVQAQDSDPNIVTDSGVYQVEGGVVTGGTNLITLQVSDEVGQLEVKFFNDLNEDGVKDADEPYLDPGSVRLIKKEDYESYQLIEGWNLVSFPIISGDIKTAKVLLDEIGKAGGYATHVSTFQNGQWKIYSERQDVAFADDFNIIPGEGYFVRVHVPTTLEVKGNKFAESLELDLDVGWNLVGIISKDTDYTADSLIEAIIGKEVGADTVTKWDSGSYVNYIKTDGVAYGNDYKIFEKGGYFIRVKESGGKFKP